MAWAYIKNPCLAAGVSIKGCLAAAAAQAQADADTQQAQHEYINTRADFADKHANEKAADGADNCGQSADHTAANKQGRQPAVKSDAGPDAGREEDNKGHGDKNEHHQASRFGSTHESGLHTLGDKEQGKKKVKVYKVRAQYAARRGEGQGE